MDHECSAKEVVNKILDRPLEWIEWRSLPEDARKQWSNDALLLLNNQVFQALCGRSSIVSSRPSSGEYVKMCIEEIARRSNSHEETSKARLCIVVAERLREMIEEMILIDSKVTNEEPNSAI